jgi:hypothetical protein
LKISQREIGNFPCSQIPGTLSTEINQVIVLFPTCDCWSGLYLGDGSFYQFEFKLPSVHSFPTPLVQENQLFGLPLANFMFRN